MGATFDTGALIAIERGSPKMQAVVTQARSNGLRISVPAGALALAWRSAPRQAPLSLFLRLPEVVVVPLDDLMARAAGVLCGRSGSDDIVDATVVICAQLRGDVIYTSDPAALRSLDHTVRIVQV